MGIRPPLSSEDAVQTVNVMTVLGSKASAPDGVRIALEHRVQCAWRAYSGIRQQLCDHAGPNYIHIHRSAVSARFSGPQPCTPDRADRLCYKSPV